LNDFIDAPKPIKNRLGPTKPSNHWKITTAERMLKPEVTRAEREQADALFRQIEKEHGGTPWAARAKEELSRGYGVELVEDFDDPRGRGVRLPKK
jgi:hypothetical protein